jgi:acyl-CoA synthetase (AMP-forming)/AMP-acid ligase II
VIISGGENIYPKEVENVIAAHPAVREVAVFGVPDERYGEAVCAVVVLWPGQNATADEIQAYCKTRMAAYKRPRYVDFHSALPRNSGDKVLKRMLRQAYRPPSI